MPETKAANQRPLRTFQAVSGDLASGGNETPILIMVLLLLFRWVSVLAPSRFH